MNVTPDTAASIKCRACLMLEAQVPDSAGHPALSQVGTPERMHHEGLDGWAVDYRCSDCGIGWHFRICTGHPTAGFNPAPYGATGVD